MSTYHVFQSHAQLGSSTWAFVESAGLSLNVEICQGEESNSIASCQSREQKNAPRWISYRDSINVSLSKGLTECVLDQKRFRLVRFGICFTRFLPFSPLLDSDAFPVSFSLYPWPLPDSSCHFEYFRLARSSLSVPLVHFWFEGVPLPVLDKDAEPAASSTGVSDLVLVFVLSTRMIA